MESAQFFGFLQEQADRYPQVFDCRVLAASARGDIQFKGVGDVGACLLEDAGCKLNFHSYSFLERAKMELAEGVEPPTR